MDFSSLVKLARPISFLRASGVIYHFSMKLISVNRIAPDGRLLLRRHISGLFSSVLFACRQVYMG